MIRQDQAETDQEGAKSRKLRLARLKAYLRLEFELLPHRASSPRPLPFPPPVS